LERNKKHTLKNNTMKTARQARSIKQTAAIAYLFLGGLVAAVALFTIAAGIGSLIK